VVEIRESTFPKELFGRYQRRNVSNNGVDKWASNSCLMCLFGGFVVANATLPTNSHIVGFG
jgi:hypothetical protein